jgi:N-acetylmuramoyl-L-alanine amidase
LHPRRLIPSLIAAALALAACAPSDARDAGGFPSRAAASPSQQAVEGVVSRERACLAEAIYFEARGTAELGQAAVAHVVLNRADSPKFPNSVCAVISDRCQFSYRCNGNSNELSNARAREEAHRIAAQVLDGTPDPTGGALFFHSARASSTGWFRTRPRVGQFGGNVFYR